MAISLMSCDDLVVCLAGLAWLSCALKQARSLMTTMGIGIISTATIVIISIIVMISSGGGGGKDENAQHRPSNARRPSRRRTRDWLTTAMKPRYAGTGG